MIAKFWRRDEGAVAPTVGLALFALVAAGGLAFDYSRMASLDTELQNAADQAALAAASQLDGESGAQTRATAAAQNLIANLTYFANDNASSGTTITIPTVEFYSSYNPNRANLTDPPGTTASGDSDSDYVRVTVGTRRANYALTPIVALLSSGDMTARALAGLGSAICNSPPVMICNPTEPSTNTNSDLGFSVGAGVGLELVSVGQSGGWAPGNFGYLQDYGTSNGLPGLREALGWNQPPGVCSPTDGVDTEPGANTPATDALNTRFDIYDPSSCPTGGTCSPASNVRSDLVRANPPGGQNGCKTHNQGWHLPSEYYGRTLPTSLTPLSDTDIDSLETMGHPRDICHALDDSHTDHCGQVGSGTWDRNAYFRRNYGSSLDWQNTSGLGSSVTRYQTYVWEMTNQPATRAVGSSDIAHKAPVCGTPLGAGSGLPDRRRISAAVVNCVAESVNGSSTGVHVVDWVDLFLVEPSMLRTRTHQADVYVEVISVTPAGSNGVGSGGPVRRDVPRILE